MNDISQPVAASRRTPVRAGAAYETPWNAIWQNLNQGFDRLLGDITTPINGGIAGLAQRALAPLPALELRETDTGYALTAELPGLAPKDVDIQVGDGMLSISGEKREESERKENGCLVSERRYGSFSRQITLPQDVDAEKIAADFKNGVLSINLPRSKDAAPKTRKIAVAG
jgi:HSP20 family protein